MASSMRVRTLSEGHVDNRRSGASEATVRRAILVRADYGAVCAVEYMLPRGIGAEIIRRVLAGGAIRAGDAVALPEAGETAAVTLVGTGAHPTLCGDAS